MATDQSGRFPIMTRRGNAYIMCMYNYDSNVIDGEPIKSRDDNDLIEGYVALYLRLKKRRTHTTIVQIG